MIGRLWNWRSTKDRLIGVGELRCGIENERYLCPVKRRLLGGIDPYTTPRSLLTVVAIYRHNQMWIVMIGKWNYRNHRCSFRFEDLDPTLENTYKNRRTTESCPAVIQYVVNYFLLDCMIRNVPPRFVICVIWSPTSLYEPWIVIVALSPDCWIEGRGVVGDRENFLSNLLG